MLITVLSFLMCRASNVSKLMLLDARLVQLYSDLPQSLTLLTTIPTTALYAVQLWYTVFGVPQSLCRNVGPSGQHRWICIPRIQVFTLLLISVHWIRRILSRLKSFHIPRHGYYRRIDDIARFFANV